MRHNNGDENKKKLLGGVMTRSGGTKTCKEAKNSYIPDTQTAARVSKSNSSDHARTRSATARVAQGRITKRSSKSTTSLDKKGKSQNSGSRATRETKKTKATVTAERFTRRKLSAHLKVQKNHPAASHGKSSCSRLINTPVGLVNSGNWCYVNSILQAVHHTPNLFNWVSNISIATITASELPENATLGHAVVLTLCEMNEKKGMRVLKPQVKANKKVKPEGGQKKLCMRATKVLEHIKGRDPNLGIGGDEQQDAEEFFTLALESMNNLKNELSRQEAGLGHSDPVNNVLSGQTARTITCQNCNTVTTNTERWQILPLPIASRKTIRECLSAIFSSEMLLDANMYNCETCLGTHNAEQASIISKYPSTLILQLLVFEHKDGQLRKLEKSIPVLKTLSLSQFASPNTNPVYELQAVVAHSGKNTASGHYTAIVRDSVNDWFTCNDSKVSLASPSDLRTMFSGSSSVKATPYILFYDLASE